MRDKVTRLCPQTTTFKEKGEPTTLPLGQTSSCLRGGGLRYLMHRRFYHDEDQLAFGMCLVLFTFLFIYFVFQDLEIAADFNVTVTMMELFDKLEQTNHVRVSASPPFHLGSCYFFACFPLEHECL